jgi:hypothetical protein
MARRTQTCAIRLAVEGGGQVKAELISVGQSGEQSLKRIESAGEPEPMRGVQFLSAWVTLWVRLGDCRSCCTPGSRSRSSR